MIWINVLFPCAFVNKSFMTFERLSVFRKEEEEEEGDSGLGNHLGNTPLLATYVHVTRAAG